MNGTYVFLTVVLYFTVLFAVSLLKSGRGDNDAFFRGNRQSPWWMVAFGMIGASVSGVSFVSVPGMVRTMDMTYMQMCVGFFLGYLVVAFVLLPLYYRFNFTSIYTYLDVRFDRTAYRTGASFFLISKMLGAAVRLYLVCLILHEFVFAVWGIPFMLTAGTTVFLIWLYTFRGGIRSLVWTDAFQTFCLLAALLLILYRLCLLNGFSVSEAVRFVADSPHSRWMEWDDWTSPRHFLKQFLSGIFVVIAMTGLDQDMMQKNLTCKSLRDAQKDMCSYGFFFIPLNLLFLSMGVLLLAWVAKEGIAVPDRGDELLPYFCAEGFLGQGVLALFTIGVIAAAFSSADSALTALTTSFCVDVLDVERRYSRPVRVRRRVHAGMALCFVLLVWLFESVNNTSVLDTIYTLASYTYGPLLGLFGFGLFTRRVPRSYATPAVCVLAPVLCLLLDACTQLFWHYQFGYELLMLNGMFTFLGLYVFSKPDGR